MKKQLITSIYIFSPPLQVHSASKDDVDKAVQAAKKAFYQGPWGSMNARDRGALLFKWVLELLLSKLDVKSIVITLAAKDANV